MKIRRGLGKLRARKVNQIALLSVCIPIACGVAKAQAAAEYAGATSVAARTTASAKLPAWTVTLPKTSNTGASLTSKTATYLTIPASPSADVVNRHAFEEKAGKDAGKLLLRSIPTAARVWMNGKFVGITPMLLILPPGKYHVEFRGQRLESGEEDIGLLPHETREIAVSLEARYPTRVSIR